MATSRQSWTGHSAALLILLFGAAVVGARLGSQSLWLDEALTLIPVLRADSLGSLFDLTQRFDTQPPASHVLLYMLRDVMPRTDFWFRLPSLVSITAGSFLLYLVVLRYWGRSTALVFAGFCAFSPLLAFYSMEARNYGLWFGLSCASLYCFAGWIDSVYKRRESASGLGWAVGFGALNGLALLTHLFHVFVIFGQGVLALVLLAYPKDRASQRALVTGSAVAHTLALVVFAPWLFRLASEFSTGEAGVPWTREFTPMNVPYYAFAAHFGTSFGPNLIDLHIRTLLEMVQAHPFSMGAGGLAVAATTYLYVRLVRDAWAVPGRRWELLVLVVLPAALVLPPLLYGALWRFPLHIRHLLCAWPLLPLVLALGVQRYRQGPPVFAGIAVLALISLANLLFNAHYAKADARGAVRYAEANSSGKVYILGDVAPLYTTTAVGELRGFQDFPPDTDDAWIVDTRRWSPQSRRNLTRAQQGLRRAGLKKLETVKQFHGVVLEHWGRRGG